MYNTYITDLGILFIHTHFEMQRNGKNGVVSHASQILVNHYALSKIANVGAQFIYITLDLNGDHIILRLIKHHRIEMIVTRE